VKIIQTIELDGRVAALVVAERAIIRDDLIGVDRRRAQAKALYALQIAAGELPGPYTEARAERYAHIAAASCARSRLRWRARRR
jgi:hypothetical protein